MKALFQADVLWSVLLLLLAAIGLTFLVPNYIAVPTKLNNPFLSPRFWPTLIFYLIGILGFCMFCKALFATYANKGVLATAQAHSKKVPEENTRRTLSVLACIGCMTVGIALIKPLGMPLAITLCVLGLLLLARKKTSIVGVLCLLALPTMLYLFFFHVADVSIPLGFFE
ncbi:tripartite tricarboxylate transporter TctB family protein [Desulfovibrio cuneatus]|uniref:tripartite tricarboxylate transporter TctB family protein n=1 Tax=Desulfovibrio cuneatus TaxID=159728 RepID=UPI00042488DF|nr:tripartite tricarboxylate transporter TctB family protein [Desulfovibrio cuneatus]